jgi:ATP-dependent RNA helicase DDX46/PRP5
VSFFWPDFDLGNIAVVVPSQLIPSATDKLELARRLASRINMAKNLGAEAKGATQQAAEAILKGGGSQPLITVSLCLLYN